ncbi:MAG: AAA family ATPase, partial [Candidatus Methanoperedens sp.]|nr:AAA family ATPase [Candidatus Methanoperedens sp.]
LVNGHVLLEGVPGTAKTSLATVFAESLGLSMRRIQATPDMMPGDITGTRIYNPKSLEFEFRPGPIFANVVVVDEINRAPPKTQAALLECMQEKQVTVDGVTFPLEEPFMVIATKNALEFEGTFPLPEAQLDRFLFRLIMSYPDEAGEIEIIRRKVAKEVEIMPVIKKSAILAARDLIHSQVKVKPEVLEYIADLVRNTNQIPKVALGASPRASVALLYAAKAYATVTEGRKYVIPDDVKAVTFDVLNHRLMITQDALFDSPEAREGFGIQFLKNLLTQSIDQVAVPI